MTKFIRFNLQNLNKYFSAVFAKDRCNIAIKKSTFCSRCRHWWRGWTWKRYDFICIKECHRCHRDHDSAWWNSGWMLRHNLENVVPCDFPRRQKSDQLQLNMTEFDYFYHVSVEYLVFIRSTAVSGTFTASGTDMSTRSIIHETTSFQCRFVLILQYATRCYSLAPQNYLWVELSVLNCFQTWYLWQGAFFHLRTRTIAPYLMF